MTAHVPALIDGEDVDTAESHTVRSPYDGREVGSVPACTIEHLDAAVAVALDRHRGGSFPAHERAAVLDRVAASLAGRVDEFARSISDESAKPITTATVEVNRAIDTVRFSAAAARTLTGELVAMEASAVGVGKLGYVKRVPVGVVAAISPFNFPLNLVCHKIAPAVAAGCPVVLKPASATPLTALRIARLFEECGLPAGWVNVVTCSGAVANHLVEHPDVSMITFTGSPEVGWGIRERAARKRVGLELGNNAPVVVTEESDWRTAAEKIGVAGYSFSGQSCISVQRVYVHRSVHGEFLDALDARVRALRVGDPADPDTEVSALITPKEADRVESVVADAVTAGGRLTVGGGRTADDVLRPMVLDGLGPHTDLSRNEIFGPVVGVAAYDDVDEAIALANDTRYGLQAGIFTNDVATALRAADALDFGGVLVNEVPTWRTDQQPYGGVRDSGNTREGPAYAVQEMTERRMVVIQG